MYDTNDASADAVQITECTYRVSPRPGGEILTTNSCLHLFDDRGAGGETFHLLVDPASGRQFNAMVSNLDKLPGGVTGVDGMFVNHQDPGASTAVAALIRKHAPEAAVLCSEDTWELIHNYQVPEDRFVALEDYPQGLKLPTGDVVRPIATPFCHFLGAMMLYDPATRVLFSGDLFSSLSDPNSEAVFAGDDHRVGLRAFHQLYMPTRSALRRALDEIRQLDPPVGTIVPHHGGIIRGSRVEKCIRWLYELPVGVDVLSGRESEPNDAWAQVLLEIVEATDAEYRELYGDAAIETNGEIGARSEGLSVPEVSKATVERAVRQLCEGKSPHQADEVKFEAVRAAARRGLPTPRIGLGEQPDRFHGSPSGFAPAEGQRRRL